MYMALAVPYGYQATFRPGVGLDYWYLWNKGQAYGMLTQLIAGRRIPLPLIPFFIGATPLATYLTVPLNKGGFP